MNPEHLFRDVKRLDGLKLRVGRRRFLTWLTRGSVAATVALVVGQIVRFLSYQPPRDDSDVLSLGQPLDYVPGELIYVAEARAFVGRDVNGLYAVDAVCTHLGCLVEHEEEQDRFFCPCHGSHFDATGQARNGPASKPLRFLHLWVQEDGQLMIDRTQPVAPDVRLT